MRTYESMLVLNPEQTEEQYNAFLEKFKGFIEAANGDLKKVDEWGKRKLAYPVQKNSQGVYTIFIFAAPAEFVAEWERRLRIEESVLLFQTVLYNEVALPKKDEVKEEQAEEPADAE